jgi:hypothetical protein
MSIFALVILRVSTNLPFPYIWAKAMAVQGNVSVEVLSPKGRPPLVAVLLRLVGGLGGRRRRQRARRRLH